MSLARAVLTDPKAPDPVVPPDLHLVRPVHADAEGTVPCVLCGKRTAYTSAEMMGSLGYACGTCARAGLTAPADQKLQRRLWPWVLGIMVVLIGGGIAFWRYQVAQDRKAFEREYPIVASDAELALIDRNVDRWDANRLGTNLSNAPKLETLTLGAACARKIENAMKFDYLDDAPTIRGRVRDLVADARRGRFDSPWAQLRVVTHIDQPVLLVRQTAREVPKLDRVEKSFTPGSASGIAYLYEPDGTLVCAGTYTAESSDSINVEFTRLEGDTSGYDTDRDHGEARGAIDRDLDAQATRAIAAALRRVN